MGARELPSVHSREGITILGDHVMTALETWRQKLEKESEDEINEIDEEERSWEQFCSPALLLSLICAYGNFTKKWGGAHQIIDTCPFPNEDENWTLPARAFE